MPSHNDQGRTVAILIGQGIAPALFGAAILGATAAQAGGGVLDSPSVRIAHAFLLDLEHGRTSSAIRRLHPTVRDDYGSDDLDPQVRLGSSGGFRRRLVADRLVEYRTVIGFRIQGLPTRGEYRIVCFTDLPASGFGRVRYLSVLLGRGRAEPALSVLSYRIRSSADPEC